MESGNEKIIMFDGRRKDEQSVGSPEQAVKSQPVNLGVFIAVFSIILTLALFFALNRNVAGLSSEVRDPGGIKDELKVLTDTQAGMAVKLAELEKLPQKTKAMLMVSLIQEMSQKAAYLGGQAFTPEQAAKLAQAAEMLDQAKAELEK